MAQQVLDSILKHSDIPSVSVENLRIDESDPVFPTQFKVATAAAAALGAIGLVISSIREKTHGIRSSVEINARFAAASLKSGKYVQVDKEYRPKGENISGFYQDKNGRWNYLHAGSSRHQAIILKVLGTLADKVKIADASKKWDSFELEAAVELAGACAPAVRTTAEWDALPNTATLREEPLVSILKIGDSEPVPLLKVDRPLSKLRALDLTRVVAGPTCTRLLAEYGADVLKVACEQYPDSKATENDTLYGKRKIILDLKSSDDRPRFEKLVRDCDVFVQSYRKDAMIDLGLSAEQVAKIRPGIIYTSLNAFGHTGAWKDRRGFDTVIQATSGMTLISGRGGTPKMTPVSALDYLGGYLMFFGTLVALKRRAEVGGSYAVDVSLARVREWLVGLGLLDLSVADSAKPELEDEELAKLLVEVPTPLGNLTRIGPVIGFSDGALTDLPPGIHCIQQMLPGFDD